VFIALFHGEDLIYFWGLLLIVGGAAFVVILVLTIRYAEAKMRRRKELEEIDERLRRQE
jgi:hypothetical protein